MEYRATAHTYTKNAFDINSIVDGVCMYLFMLSIGMEHKLHKNAILSTLISNGHKAMRRRRKNTMQTWETNKNIAHKWKRLQRHTYDQK